MSGFPQQLRFIRPADVVRDLVEARRRLQQLCDPVTLRRLRVIAFAGAAPVVVAVGVSALTGLSSGRLDGAMPPPATPVPAVIASRWTPAPSSPSSTTSPARAVAGASHDTLRASEGLSSALARHGVGSDDVSALLRALRGSLPARALPAGTAFAVTRAGAALSLFVLTTETDDGVPRTVTARRRADVPPVSSDDAAAPRAAAATAATRRSTGSSATGAARFDVAVQDAVVEVVVEGLAGSVTSTLRAGIVDAGGDQDLVARFVDVFSWDVDVDGAARAGDEFRVLVEKRYATAGEARRFLGYGKVVAAEYVVGGQTHRAFSYTSADGRVSGVFDEAGASRRRALLKSPLDLTMVTSTNDRRFAVGERGPAVDYGAPLGTPTWSTGDGVVVDARFDKAGGNRVVVDHGGQLSTEYLHLSRFAEGIKPGVRIAQKQLLGFVGSTGASAGPHLRYGLRRGGSAVDVDSAGATSAAPLPAAYRSSFDTFVAPLVAQLRALARA
jgi:murein DD-endopeptidase MepM/ murein hydrolase activator NlpD